MGYDETRFLEQPGDEFKCQICCDVLKDPVECGVCQSSFCQQCIDTWREKSENCPNRCLLKLQPCHRQFKNIYLRLKLHCKFQGKGCDQVLSLDDVEKHENKLCLFRVVKCRHEGCDFSNIAKVAEDHDRECPWARETCPECENQFFRRDRLSHNCLKTLMEQLLKIGEANLRLEKQITELENAVPKEGVKRPNYAMTAQQVHMGVTCNGCAVSPIRGKRFICLKCEKFDVCELCRNSVQHAHNDFLELTSSEAHEGVTCDICRVSPISGLRYKCKECGDFDMCHRCRLTHPHPHQNFAVFQPFWVVVQPIPEDRRSYKVSELFTRSWMLVNLGPETISNVVLNCIAGEPGCKSQVGAHTSFQYDCRLRQNGSFIISVTEQVIQLAPGDYESEWAVSTLDRCSFFGPRLVYRLTVL